MAKTKRKWIDLDYSSPTSLRAEDIPYDTTQSVRDAILSLSTTGIQGLQGATGVSIFGGPQGETGLQGLQGITGLGDLQPGVTGLQGPIGTTGIAGIQGVTGFRGATGLQGATGFVHASPIPSSYNTLSTPVDASTSSFVDIPGASTVITLDSASQIFATMSFEMESIGAGSYPTGAFRIVINSGPLGPDSTGTALEKYLLPDDVSLGTVTHLDGIFSSGLYTVKGQFRRVSGQQKVRVNSVQIYAQSLRGGKGDLGLTGVQGHTGMGIQGSTGILGPVGPLGATGLEGPTGIQGHTGLGIQGVTGLQGPTGILGPQGSTGMGMPSPIPSNFIYFDGTHQLFDNSSTYVDIPGLSIPIVVDASGSCVYSAMTLETDSTSSPAGIGQYITGSFRIVVGDQTSLAYERFVQNDDDLESHTLQFRTDALADGTYIAHGQISVVPKLDATTYGDKFFGVRKGQLYVQSLQGSVGPEGMMGPRGYDGATGVQGHTGMGIQGVTGLEGTQGQTGIAGLGVTGLRGATGIGYLSGATGVQGATGLGGSSLTGMQGATGIGSPSLNLSFSPVSKYQVASSAGAEVWATSSSTVYHNLHWDRTGTVLNIYRDAHGHAAGNRVIVRNTNMDYQVAPIDSTSLNSFSITTAATDGSVGNFGAYSLGFIYAHDASPSTGGTLFAPQGDHSDCQLLSLRIRTGVRVGSTYTLTVPASAVNGAGANTSLADCYVPDFNVRNDNNALSAVAATMTTNIGGSYSTFQFGNLGTSTLSRMIVVHF